MKEAIVVTCLNLVVSVIRSNLPPSLLEIMYYTDQMRYRNLMFAMIMLFTLSVMMAGYLNGGLAGDGNNNNVVSGNVIDSKYLAITFHKYVNQKDTDVITGTIVNNSTKDISSVRIYAALFDDNNRLITTEGGVVNVPSLTPTLTSPFTVSLLNIQKPDHYTLFPGGTPS